jgi:hypothetical protein
MSFFKEFDVITNNFIINNDREVLINDLVSLHEKICSSVDDALFSNSHKELKRSINAIVERQRKKLLEVKNE